MVWTVPPTDVMLKVLGAPHSTDLFTSVFRLSQALLDQGATLQVWACGQATGITHAALGTSKPPNVLDRGRDYPSTSAIVQDLLAAHHGRLYWYVCRFCCEERGVSHQIPQVRKRPAARFWEHVRACQKLLALGAG